ncbi:MAG: uncharacterized protein PWQ28_740 [Candidatus Woesearchaeota archaeon]|nr:uncharacterized protein [Candidatus Woesearchaeota archaeon]
MSKRDVKKEIKAEKLNQYLMISKKAVTMAENAINYERERDALIVLDMAKRYLSDAEYFKRNGDYVNGFAAVNYAHGWLDAGARLGLFDVHDNKLFVVDDEEEKA